jgi:hypothetical protein
MRILLPNTKITRSMRYNSIIMMMYTSVLLLLLLFLWIQSVDGYSTTFYNVGHFGATTHGGTEDRILLDDDTIYEPSSDCMDILQLVHHGIVCHDDAGPCHVLI